MTPQPAPWVTPPEYRGRYAIVVEPDAIVPEQTAARELQTHLEPVLGRAVAIVTNAAAVPANHRPIYVGQTQTVRDRLPSVQWSSLGKEDVIIKTVGPDIFLAGGRPRGALYAVYSFLEDYVGVRWWTHSETYLPKQPDLVIPAIDYTYRPPFWYRESVFRETTAADHLRKEPDNQARGLFGVRRRLNGFWQGKFADIEQYGGHFGVYGMYHTFHWYLLRPAIYFKKHPEWYSLVNGQRTDKGQLCLTNDEMRKELTRVALSRIDSNKPLPAIAISMTDAAGNCECPNCAASDKKYGSPAGTLIEFLNKVTRDINAKYPDMLVTTLAYYYNSPPPRGIRPDKNIMVYWCADKYYAFAPLTDPRNAPWLKELKGWAAITDKLVAYDYFSSFSFNPLFPHPNLRVIGPNIKLYRDLGLDGALIEGYGVNGDGDFVQLRSWLASGLLWNPDQDPERLIAEFMRGYYGAAAEPLMAYQRLMETYWHRYVPIVARGHYTFDYVKIALMNEAEELFNRAEAAVADAPELLARVRRDRMPLRALWIERYHDLRRQAAESGAPFRGPADPLAALADYKADLAKLDVRHVSYHQSLEELFTRWEDFIKIPPQPVKDLEPAKPGVRVMQEDDLILLFYGKHLRLVADPLASNGRAVYSEGGDYSWALRYQGALAPGRYRVRIRIRVDRAKDTGSAFVVGLYDNTAHRERYRFEPDISKVPGPGYHWYDIGTWELGPNDYIYVTPPRRDATAIDALYVDCYEFTREL